MDFEVSIVISEEVDIACILQLPLLDLVPENNKRRDETEEIIKEKEEERTRGKEAEQVSKRVAKSVQYLPSHIPQYNLFMITLHIIKA